MKVLIVGGGGREHALAWKCTQSARVERVFVAPGNGGTAGEPGVENVAIGVGEADALLQFAREQAVGLTIIGPEAPLVAGIVDRFEAAGLACFGPVQAAAQLEGSKAFTKSFLMRHGIPTARFGTFEATADAYDFIARTGAPLVVKADGLAAGKGVVIAGSEADAREAAAEMLEAGRFGSAGQRIVIEEFLDGEEASFIVMSDGEHVLPLASSQDHKRRDDGDRGPNTGGMGAYSPAPVVTPALHETIMRRVIQPTVDGMRADGVPYRGFLYAGVMVRPDGTPAVLEFNCRFGDPEAQPVLMRLDSDLVELCLAALRGGLDHREARWDARVALGVVMATRDYPERAGPSERIAGLDTTFPADVKIFHGGTRRDASGVHTTGGRVLCVTALGQDVRAARAAAYGAAEAISWPGARFRRDIGFRALERETGGAAER